MSFVPTIDRRQPLPQPSIQPDTFSKKILRLLQRIKEAVARIFATLTYPLSLLWQGLVRRAVVEKSGVSSDPRFQNSSSIKQPFDTDPLTQRQIDKVWHWIHRTINDREKAIQSGNGEAIAHSDGELQRLYRLVSHSQAKYSTRNDFNTEDWKLLDCIDFSLLKEQLSSLSTLFSRSNEINAIQKTFHSHFGIDYKESLLAETLALSLATIMGLDGETIDLPVKNDKDETWSLASFKIHSGRLGDDLPFYLLDNADYAPWLVIRGTEMVDTVDSHNKELRPGSRESLLADLIDHRGIAPHAVITSIIKKEQKNLSDLFLRLKQQGKLIKLSGHSLGGYFANVIGLHFWDQVDRSYTFSPPGASAVLAKRWRQKCAHSSVDKIVNYLYEKDFVPTGGGYQIGNCLAIGLTNSPPLKDPLHRHITSHLDRPFEVHRVDLKKENNKLSRRVAEAMRATAGLFVRLHYSIFNRKKIPSWWRNKQPQDTMDRMAAGQDR